MKANKKVRSASLFQNESKGGDLSTDKLTLACKSVINHFESIGCVNRNDVLQVLMHVTAAFLADYPPDHVAGYFVKITRMLDGKFDVNNLE